MPLRSKKAPPKGFSTVELMVVVGIFAIISAVTIFNYRASRGAANLDVLVQDVALTIRRAQAYTLGFQNPSLAGSGTVVGYGTRFDLSEPDAFLLFGDFLDGGTAGNRQYDGSACNGMFAPGEECYDRISIATQERLELICVNGDSCMGGSGAIDIVFSRPNPDASFMFSDPSTGYPPIPYDPWTGMEISHVRLEFASPSGMSKSVTVWNTGQISVQ